LSNIPTTIIQTSKYKLKNDDVKNKILEKCSSNYNYKHFTDEEIVEYFEKNPISDFPNILEVFNSFTNGPHKADLFRYYYLYLEGGIYIDTDLELQSNIHLIIKDYEFVSVESCYSNVLFNGFIAVTSKHKIMYDLLKMTYNISNLDLRDNYLLICIQSFPIYLKYKNSKNYIYKETRYNDYTIIFDEKTPLLKHNWKYKNNLL